MTLMEPVQEKYHVRCLSAYYTKPCIIRR